MRKGRGGVLEARERSVGLECLGQRRRPRIADLIVVEAANEHTRTAS